MIGLAGNYVQGINRLGAPVGYADKMMNHISRGRKRLSRYTPWRLRSISIDHVLVCSALCGEIKPKLSSICCIA